jgi:hypothetical protein
VVHLGQYLIVMEKISGEWKIVQHFSLNAGETQATNACQPLALRERKSFCADTLSY